MKRLIYVLALAVGCADEGVSIQPASEGSTTYTLRIENVAPWTVLKSGTHGSGPIGPGETFLLRFTGGNGHAINFVTMYGESNDWFFAPGPEGIPLFDAHGAPMAGDVTSYVKLWNAGTEIDQEPGVGDATAPQQPSPNFGAPDPDPRVRVIRDDIRDLVQVMLVPSGDREFTLKIMNCVASNIHLSPLVHALHRMPAPFFDPGEPDRGDGLEALAEDGMIAELAASIAEVTGFHTPLSPGVVIAGGTEALFTVGQRDRGEGLVRIAEDGDPSELAANRPDAIVFDTPVGKTEPGPAMPGEAYEVRLSAELGDRIAFVTMFGMSNDWFFAGDVDEVALYDAGSERDQEPDIGRFTAPQQPAPNTGPPDPDANVRAADYTVPSASHVRVTIVE